MQARAIKLAAFAALGLTAAGYAAARAPDAWLAGARGRLASRRPLKIAGLTMSGAKVGRFGRLELTFQLGGTYDNPFDPQQVEVGGEFTAPSGERVTMPGFHGEGYRLDEQGTPVPTGESAWRLRVAPTEVGAWSYRVGARDRTGATAEASGRFECVASDARGFVRVHPENPRYLAFQSGETYLPIGINLFAWWRIGQPLPAGRLAACLGQLERLAAHGGNFARLRADSWWLAIEMSPDRASGFLGPGYYHPQVCWEIDRLVERAAARGVYVMFCAGNGNGTVNLPEKPTGRNQWRAPYNLYVQANGGPCESSGDFWTHPEAKRLVRQKLRYIVARWGYSPHVLAWEFWNEVAIGRCPVKETAAWHDEMSRTWRSIDPYARPVTTSLMSDPLGPAAQVWKLPVIDIVQQHLYRRPDIADAHAKAVAAAARAYRKPFLIGEYGIGDIGGFGFDPRGLNLHNGLWASPFAGACGTGAFWYIANYVEKRDLWFHYRAFADFAKAVRWERFATTFEVAEPFPLEPDRPRERRPIVLVVPLSTQWTFEVPPATVFAIGDDGSIARKDMIRPYLHCSQARKAPPTFVVNLLRPATFEVHVSRSVGDESNALVLRLDGRETQRVPFPAGKGKGKGKSDYVEQYKNWRTPYDTTVAVEVPAGQHRIQPEAVGKDRLEVDYLFRNLLATAPRDPLRLLSFDDGQCVYLWIQSRMSTWKNLQRGIQPNAVRGMATRIDGLRDGCYVAEWWDTWRGRWSGKEQGESRAGVLVLPIPEVTRDIACRVQHQDGKPLRE